MLNFAYKLKMYQYIYIETISKSRNSDLYKIATELHMNEWTCALLAPEWFD